AGHRAQRRQPVLEEALHELVVGTLPQQHAAEPLGAELERTRIPHRLLGHFGRGLLPRRERFTRRRLARKHDYAPVFWNAFSAASTKLLVTPNACDWNERKSFCPSAAWLRPYSVQRSACFSSSASMVRV